MNMAYYYIAPLFVFAWWIVTVTYLQHHDPHTKVYDDSNWNYVTAAFETVDRTYGTMIDDLSHHITDGHVVHHLFFTKIPHYNLPDASIALRKYMSDHSLADMYRYEDTRDFMIRVHKYFYLFGFKSAEVAKTESTLNVNTANTTNTSTSKDVMSPVTISSSLSTDNIATNTRSKSPKSTATKKTKAQ